MQVIYNRLGCDSLAGEKSIPERYGTIILDEFEFESGEVLKDVEVEYYTSGEPRFDADGNIINMVLYCPTIRGTQSLLNQDTANRGFSLKKEEYFYIHISTLGAPNSCSPSTTDLKWDFPTYTFKDRVNFKRQFLKKYFKFKKIQGICGEGLGGFEIFTWACEYPDDMEFIIVLNSSYATNGFRYVISKSIENMIESSEVYNSDVYSSAVTNVVVSLNKFLFSYYFPRRIFARMDNHEIDYIMDEYVDEGLFLDLYDFKKRNDCILSYDVEDKLKNIKAKSLFVSTYDNVYFTPEFDTLPLKDKIKDSQIFLFHSKRENYYDEEDFSEMTEVVEEFIKPFSKKILEASKY